MIKKRSFRGLGLGPIGSILAITGLFLRLVVPTFVAPIASPLDALPGSPAVLDALAFEICRDRVGRAETKRHDGTIVTNKINEMWGTDMTQTITVEDEFSLSQIQNTATARLGRFLYRCRVTRKVKQGGSPPQKLDVASSERFQ